MASNPAASQWAIPFATFLKVGSLAGIGLALCFFVFGAAMSLFIGHVLGSAELHSSTSPDRAWKLVVTQRTRWFDIADPPAELSVSLYSTTTGELIDSVDIGVDEDSDVGTPSASWQSDAVVVAGLEKHHALTATLRWTGPRP